MELMVNGETRNVNNGATLKELLDFLKIRSSWVVCEVNGSIVKKDKVAGSTLSEGDKIEIVHFIGGG